MADYNSPEYMRKLLENINSDDDREDGIANAFYLVDQLAGELQKILPQDVFNADAEHHLDSLKGIIEDLIPKAGV